MRIILVILRLFVLLFFFLEKETSTGSLIVFQVSLFLLASTGLIESAGSAGCTGFLGFIIIVEPFRACIYLSVMKKVYNTFPLIFTATSNFLSL
jgi:hypothetical protein